MSGMNWRVLILTTDTARSYVDQSGIYLLTHSVGLPRVGAMSILQDEFYDPWAVCDEQVWPAWMAGIEKFRSELGRLFATDGANFCPQSSVSSAVTKLIQSLPQRTGKTAILLSEEDFPSLAFALEKSSLSNFELQFIPAEEDVLDLNVWEKYLTPKVGVVLLTHVQPNNGKQLPVGEIIDLARPLDILTLVDVAQSAAVVPIDFEQWQPDFVVGSCVKWSSGGPGAAYLWVHPSLVCQLKPLDVGWFSHENPFEFDIYNFRYSESVLRFWGGTPSVIPYLLAAHSLSLINNDGIHTIREHNLRLTEKLINAVAPQSLVSPASPDQRGGTLVLDFQAQQDGVTDALRAANVHFDARATGIRLSPHVYNSDDQIDELLSCFP